MASSPCFDGLYVQPNTIVFMWDYGASHSSIAKSVVKSHHWIVNRTKSMPICLATGSKFVLTLMCSVPLVFCDDGGHTITKNVKCQVI